jgi:hypothetical protein
VQLTGLGDTAFTTTSSTPAAFTSENLIGMPGFDATAAIYEVRANISSGAQTYDVGGGEIDALLANNYTALSMAPGFVAYWDAGFGVTLNGSNVVDWAPRYHATGYGISLTQATPANGPTVTAGWQNGKKGLAFSGSQWLATAAWTTALAQPLALYAVLHTSDTTSRFVYDGITSSARAFAVAHSSNQLTRMAWGAPNSAVTTNWDWTSLQVMTVLYDGGHTINVPILNGVIKSNAGNVGSNGLTGLTVGAAYDHSSPFAGTIGGLLLCNAVHDPTANVNVGNPAGPIVQKIVSALRSVDFYGF